MKQFLLALSMIVLSLFGSIYTCDQFECVDEGGFTPLERQKMGQQFISPTRVEPMRVEPATARCAPKSTPPRVVKFLPTIAVKFDMLIDGETILYDTPVFTLDGEEVICQVCGRPPAQIEVTNGKLKCFCFNHIPRKRGSFLD